MAEESTQKATPQHQAAPTPTVSSAARKLEKRMADARVAEEAAQRELNETITRNREAAHEAYSESEQGQVAAQIAESERIMRLPTPEAHEALGSSQPDPLKGPSS